MTCPTCHGSKLTPRHNWYLDTCPTCKGQMAEIIRTESQEPQPWTIEKGKSFAYRFVDSQGRERGRFKDADSMATHFVFALQRIERQLDAAELLYEALDGLMQFSDPRSGYLVEWHQAMDKAAAAQDEWDALKGEENPYG